MTIALTFIRKIVFTCDTYNPTGWWPRCDPVWSILDAASRFQTTFRSQQSFVKARVVQMSANISSLYGPFKMQLILKSKNSFLNNPKLKNSNLECQSIFRGSFLEILWIGLQLWIWTRIAQSAELTNGPKTGRDWKIKGESTKFNFGNWRFQIANLAMLRLNSNWDRRRCHGIILNDDLCSMM